MTTHSSAPADGVQLRTLVAGPLPLLVASVGAQKSAAQLRAAVADAGLMPVSSFLGSELQRGARVGFVIEGQELRLVNDRDEPLLRAPRQGLDQAWIRVALARKGTMFIVVQALDLSGQEPASQLAQHVDEAARSGRAIGAIVGVVEERPKLPLLF